MKRLELRRLPTHFRYLLTIKEIKSIETELNKKFDSITSGRTDSGNEKFENDSYLKSSLRIITITGYKRENVWHFTLILSAFRKELLPEKFEEKAKSLTIEKTKEYLNKILNSRETDLINSPSIWGHLIITDSGLKIDWIENK